MSTRRYLLVKVLQALLTLLFVLSFNFFLFRGLGDPTLLLAKQRGALTEKAQLQLKQELGLDLPEAEQFVHYLGQTLEGHLGLTFDNQPVSSVIGAAIWPTVLLVGTSTIACTIIGLWIGIAQGWRWGSKFDQVWLGITLVLYAMPEFWFGLVMIMLLSVTFQIFPSGAMTSPPPASYHGLALIADVLKHLTLPFFVLTVSYLAEYSLIMRSSLTEVLAEDYILTARSKGVKDKSVRRHHAVPNALLAPITISVLYIGYIFGGAILIEEIFSWPGLGKLTFDAITSQDYALLEGLFLLFSAAVIVANVVADLLYSYLDPRVKAA